jgi:cell division protein ZapA (FtsZ GTPase activity inhibitor)
MSKTETISLRIFGRDLTIACPPKEKNNLIKAAELLNAELDSISDKNNALIIAGLTLANKLLTDETKSSEFGDINISKLVTKIDKALKK